MSEVNTNELKRAVENQHGCTATVLEFVPVKETFDGNTVWDGIVHVFRIDGHPKARKAYAWSSPIVCLPLIRLARRPFWTPTMGSSQARPCRWSAAMPNR